LGGLDPKQLDAWKQSAQAKLDAANRKWDELSWKTGPAAVARAGGDVSAALNQWEKENKAAEKRVAILTALIEKIDEEIARTQTLNEVMAISDQLGLHKEWKVQPEEGFVGPLQPASKLGVAGLPSMIDSTGGRLTNRMRDLEQYQDKISINQRDLMESIRKDNELLIDGALALGDTLRGSLGGAFEEVFGTANSLLEQFAQRLFEILGQRLIFSALSLIPGVGAFLGGGMGATGGEVISGGGGGMVGGGLAGAIGKQGIMTEKALSSTAYRTGSYRAALNADRLGRVY